MKQILDLIPLVVFFAVYKLFDIYLASAALVVASLLQLCALKLLYKKIENIQWFSCGLICLFGGLTYFFTMICLSSGR